MANIGEKELREMIKSSSFSNAYFIYGEETYLKEFYLKEMKKKLVDKAFEDFNLHIYEGKNMLLDDILQDAQMLPMMSEYNLVIAYDYPLTDSENDIKAIKEYLKDLPQNSVLVFVYMTTDIDVKKSSKWKSIITAFSKAGSSVNLEKRTEYDLIKLLESGAKKRGATLSKDNAKYLISVCGSDMKTLMNELEKMAMFVNGNEITKAIIDDMATKCLQAKIFDLTKALVIGKTDIAFDVLETLLDMKEDPISIMAVISNCYVDMYRVKCASIAGENPEDVGNYFNYRGREFTLRNALTNSRRMSVEALRNSLDIISSADTTLKSTTISPKIVLEETLMKLIMTAGSSNA